HRGDVHRQATRQLGIAALELHQHADAATVDVRGDGVGAVDAGHAADLQVLADLGDHRGTCFFDGIAGGQLGGLQRVDVGGRQGRLADGVGEGQEVVVFGDEVGLGVDLDQHGL